MQRMIRIDGGKPHEPGVYIVAPAARWNLFQRFMIRAFFGWRLVDRVEDETTRDKVVYLDKR